MPKAVLLAFVLGLIAYLTQSLAGTIIFGSMALALSLGRSVLLGATAAVLLGVCFPRFALAVAVVAAFYVIVTPTKSSFSDPA